MVSRVVARVTALTGALAVALALGVGPAAAQAKPKAPPAPTAVQIESKDLPRKIVVEQKSRSQLFQMLMVEVSWLANGTPQASAPSKKALGPRYLVTVLVKNAPQQVYELYPLAVGGPRAHRPAKQPSGKKVDGWFYGRQTMRETLRISGAPIKAKLDVVSSGVGGGVGEDLAIGQVDPVASVNDLLTEMRRLILLNGAVVVVILFGLAGFAYLIRRRV